MAGDNLVRSLLEKLLRSASSAYLCILERWVYDGVIDYPYGEFFIGENRSLQKESLTRDYDAKYWQQRYSLKHEIPKFLTNAATTGKYLNVMRECGHSVQVPLSEPSKFTSFGSNHHNLECINTAYDFASSELLNLVMKKYDLVVKLRSLKHYFLLDQGDFLVHFMDMGREELAKKVNEMSAEKLQLLCGKDIFADFIGNIERSGEKKTNNLLVPLNSLEIGCPKVKTSDQTEAVSLTGLETFTLNYKVQWPLSLVISRKALLKYQMIFRFLFHSKHVHRQLCGAWQVHQGARSLNMLGTTLGRSSLLCRSMLKFMNSLLHYLTFEVLEPNWHEMHDTLQTVKSIDEVILFHDNFLRRCLRECLLLVPQLLKGIGNLELICLQYAATAVWPVPSLLPDTDDDKGGLEKSNLPMANRRGRTTRLVIENASTTDTVATFETEFHAEIRLNPEEQFTGGALFESTCSADFGS